MVSELIINARKNIYRIALLKNNELVEYHVDEKDNHFSVGDIYLGVVKKIIPGLNAAFINIGYEKDAFLHYLDLGLQFNSINKFLNFVNGNLSLIKNFNIGFDIDKFSKINDVLFKGQKILVQIIKESIASKGPRLSCSLSIAGRYIILIPFINSVSISKKILSIQEKNRLKRLISYIKPKNFGIVIRTAAEFKNIIILDNDLKILLERWYLGIKKIVNSFSQSKIIGEVDRISSILRDILNESFDNIIIDDKKSYDETKKYIQNVVPEKVSILKFYQGRTKIFENFGIEKCIKKLFGKTVSLEGGGYIIIEHTEAMHVIDVNSGNKAILEENQESTALNVNIASVKEIARQLVVRDMGGIIVVDFIDMKILENKNNIYQKMKDYMKGNRSKITVLPISRFGIMQITRQRIRPEMNVITKEKCPTCHGSGMINASILVSDKIEKNIKFLLLNKIESVILIFVHPYIYSFFTKGFFSIRMSWLFNYKNWVALEKDSSLAITEFKFFNKYGKEFNF